MPRLYSGCYGLGSRDLQPEALVAAIENMLPDGRHKPFFYLSVDFVHDTPANPKQEIWQQNLVDAYPQLRELAIHGSENPDLTPKGSTTVRMHSVGGWGAITTGKNLAMTLFDLLGFDIKANPKYGSEKKGQPTTYYLSAAPEPIRLNCEYHYVDVVMSPDPNVFGHSNPLAGLNPGGVFIIQSELNDAAEADAITEVFGAGAVPVVSTKGVTGHALGAAGALEAIFSLLMLENDFIARSVNVETLDPALNPAEIATETVPGIQSRSAIRSR